MVNAVLTRPMVRTAIALVKPTIERMAVASITNKGDLHIVVLNPSATVANSSDFASAILLEDSVGDVEGWSSPYDDIARSKAEITWRTGMTSHEVQYFAPHLYQEGDTRFGGSVNFYGIIVACSGVQSEFDRMFAEWIASAIRALAVNTFRSLTEVGDAPTFFGQPDGD